MCMKTIYSNRKLAARQLQASTVVPNISNKPHPSSIIPSYDNSIIEKSFNDVHIEMEKEELYNVINDVEKIYPKIIVEIGVKYGGTLNVWRKIIPPDGSIIAIDRENVLKFDIGQDPRIIFIQGDSLNHKTYQDFMSALDNREIDFLFIDGGHKYRETKSDFYTFGWHVRKGGLIAFHDIYLDSEGDIEGSSKHFWNEVKQRSGKHWKVVSEISINTGTGIIIIL